ncbi:MAG TPA: alpha/beta fold hydrolase [Ktedonobacteraceae bacterium]|nr:alpha/beta fold hydrolase [Ktedonobacteraceae bacterium]
MLYQPDAPGDWGQMLETDTVKTSTSMLKTSDGCEIFLRSWVTDSPDVLLILHGLGAHSGWFIDMGNKLASRGMTVYAMDHRGFGRSGGLSGHIGDYHTYIEDINCVVTTIRKRHPEASVHILGHSMGAIFASHYAAKYQSGLASVLFLNPWVKDSSQTPVLTTLRILVGGIFKSRRYWQVAGGSEVMTANPEAIQTLQTDTYWIRKQTSSLLYQIFLMRSAMLKNAKLINKPGLVMQAESDKSVVSEASHTMYNALAVKDKIWRTFPGYEHDSEFEADRTLLDNEIVSWITEHVKELTTSRIA